MPKGRYFRPRDISLKGTPYDSLLEKHLHQSLEEMGLPCEFHPAPIPYVSRHHYNPDFKVEHKGESYLLEAKGYFQDSSEAAKYIWFRESNPSPEVIFIFEGPYKKLPWAKQRKDNSFMNHAEWADKNGFRWYSAETFHEFFD